MRRPGCSGLQYGKGEDLTGATELETFTGATLEVAAEGDTITLNGGQATVVVPDIQTANATVHLIDTVMMPPPGKRSRFTERGGPKRAAPLSCALRCGARLGEVAAGVEPAVHPCGEEPA